MSLVKVKKPFQYRTLPWILLAVLGILDLAVLISGMLLNSWPAVFLLWFAIGAAVGGFFAYLSVKTIRGNRDYLQLKQGIIFSAIASLIGMITSAPDNWLMIVCLILSGIAIAFLAMYVPRYTKIHEDIASRNANAG